MALHLRPLQPAHYPPGEFPIPNGDRVFCVGRDHTNDLCVDDASVSARHARIEVLGDRGFEVVDCGSINGTFVNGIRVDRSILKAGDFLRFATAEFLVAEGEGGSAAMKSEGAPERAGEPVDQDEAAAGEPESESESESEAGELDPGGVQREEKLHRLVRDLEEATARDQRLQKSLNEARREVIDREGIIAGLRYEIRSRDGQLRQLDEQRTELQRVCDAQAAAELEREAEWEELVARHDREVSSRARAEQFSSELQARLSQLGANLLRDWRDWISEGFLPSESSDDASELFHRLEATAAAIRGQLDLIEPIWHQFGDGVRAELARQTMAHRAELAEVEGEIVRRREELAAIRSDLEQLRKTMDAELRRAQGLSRKGIEVEIPERFEAMLIPKDREQEIYRALIERLEVLDLLLGTYRNSQRLKEILQELSPFRNHLASILEDGGVRPFSLELGTILSPRHRREVQVLSRKGWGTRPYYKTPFQPGEVVKVVRPGYRVGDGDAAVVLRKVEVLIRGGVD